MFTTNDKANSKRTLEAKCSRHRPRGGNSPPGYFEEGGSSSLEQNFGNRLLSLRAALSEKELQLVELREQHISVVSRAAKARRSWEDAIKSKDNVILQLQKELRVRKCEIERQERVNEDNVQRLLQQREEEENAELQQKERQISVLEAKSAHTVQELVEKQKLVTRLKKQIDDKEKDCVSHLQKIELFSGRVHDLKAALHKSEEVLETHKKFCQQLKTLVWKRDSVIGQLQLTEQQLQSTLARQEAEIQALDCAKEKLKDEKELAEKELKTTKLALQRRNEQTQRLEKSLRAADDALRHKTEEQLHVLEENRRYRKELSNKEHRVEQPSFTDNEHNGSLTEESAEVQTSDEDLQTTCSSTASSTEKAKNMETSQIGRAKSQTNQSLKPSQKTHPLFTLTEIPKVNKQKAATKLNLSKTHKVLETSATTCITKNHVLAWSEDDYQLRSELPAPLEISSAPDWITFYPQSHKTVSSPVPDRIYLHPAKSKQPESPPRVHAQYHHPVNPTLPPMSPKTDKIYNQALYQNITKPERRSQVTQISAQPDPHQTGHSNTSHSVQRKRRHTNHKEKTVHMHEFPQPESPVADISLNSSPEHSLTVRKDTTSALPDEFQHTLDRPKKLHSIESTSQAKVNSHRLKSSSLTEGSKPHSPIFQESVSYTNLSGVYHLPEVKPRNHKTTDTSQTKSHAVEKNFHHLHDSRQLKNKSKSPVKFQSFGELETQCRREDLHTEFMAQPVAPKSGKKHSSTLKGLSSLKLQGIKKSPTTSSNARTVQSLQAEETTQQKSSRSSQILSSDENGIRSLQEEILMREKIWRNTEAKMRAALSQRIVELKEADINHEAEPTRTAPMTKESRWRRI